MFPQLGQLTVTVPIPIGDHLFNEFAYGDKTYTIRHWRRAASGLPVETGLPTASGRIEITESSLSTLRGRIDLSFNYYADLSAPPTVRRLRGSFWAIPDPTCVP